MTTRRSRRRPSNGFTLVEVLVATAVLAVGLVGALTAFSMATRVTGASQNGTVLAFLAQQKLAEIEARGAYAIADAETAGDFGPAHPEYHWQLIIQEPDERNLVGVDLLITTEETNGTRETRYSTILF